MSASAPTTATPVPAGGQSLILSAVDWHAYERFLAACGDRGGLRLTYDGSNLEFRVPSREHEQAGRFLGQLIEALTLELDIPVASCKSLTCRRADLERGLEPDECYHIQNEPRVRAMRDLDLTRDPPPDLAVEVDVTRSSLDRVAIYGALGVPELWRFGEDGLSFLHRQGDGTYRAEPVSRAFPFLPAVVVALFAGRAGIDGETALLREFVAWVRREVAPVLRP